jgi:sugar lactone lactonase YvrE
LIALASLVACTPPGPPGGGGRKDDPPVHTAPPVVGSATAETGDTATVAETGDTAVDPPIDCSGLVAAGDITWTSTNAIVTEEDFDFDDQGFLLMQRSNDLQGVDRQGNSHPVAPNTGDPTGIRSTSTGLVVIAQPGQGAIELINPANGASATLLAGLSQPNGLEAGGDGMIYVTENVSNGRVRMVDPTDGSFAIVAEVPYPNGVVLSPDDQVLYFTSSDSSFGGQTRIVSVARDADGRWDGSTLQLLYTHPEYVGSITMDACGNLYGLEYLGGRVFRMDTTTLVVEPIADFQTGGSWSALHFSPGLEGWDLDTLYVTSRSQLWMIPTGVPGSHVLTP